MTEKRLKLEIGSLLPNVKDEEDGCLRRLTAAVQSHQGISEAHLDCDGAIRLCLHYQPDLVSGTEVKQVAERAGTEITERYHHDLIPLEGMHCSDCVTVIEHGISRVAGVLTADVRYATKNMWIEYDSHTVKRTQIEKRVKQLGYRVPVEGRSSWHAENRELIFSLLCGLCLLIGWAGERFLRLPFSLHAIYNVSAVSLLFYLSAYAFGGFDTTRHAIQAIREKHFDIDLLMVVAAIGAAFLGEFSEGALLLFLFGVGHVLEERALDKARNAISSLAELTPRTAVVKREEGESEESVDDLEIGAVVIVRPGIRIPVDGEIVAGRSSVNESPVTGESMPVEKASGSSVFAGSINGEGSLEVQVARLSDDSTLARVMKMVVEAQAQKSPAQQMTEKFSRVFVPLILISDLLLIFALPLFGIPFSESFLRGMVLLVAASPCALALGTPSAILAGIAQAARNGVLIKGGVHLENLGRMQAIAFDKTGTITKGEPEVTDIIPIGKMEVNHWLGMAAAVESRSAHPIAQAIVNIATTRGLRRPQVDELESITGRGIKAEVAGTAVWIGSMKLYSETRVDIPESIRTKIEGLEEQGKTTMLVALDKQPVGVIAVADVIRTDANTALARLKQMRIGHTVMLTGDNARVAAHIAQQAGVMNYEADLLPEDKVTAVRQLITSHNTVAMVGDGINDAPALANATIGIAMGGAGTDVALETADVALMGDDLSKLSFAVGLGRATRTVIVQNLSIALAVIGGLMISSILGIATIGVAIILHEGSTIFVVLNSLRLLQYRERSDSRK